MTHGDILNLNGKHWRIAAIGASVEGRTYLHLTSVSEGVQQKNGHRPQQIAGWLGLDGQLSRGWV